MFDFEKFKFGQFSLTEKEKEEAGEKGNLAEQEAKMKQATETLRVKQAEEAIKDLEKAAEKEKLDNAA